ncbi:MAG: ATP-binding protein [Candidatus Methylomirabilales bacterium]
MSGKVRWLRLLLRHMLPESVGGPVIAGVPVERIFDELTDGLALLDRKGRWAWANRKMTEMLGCEIAELATLPGAHSFELPEGLDLARTRHSTDSVVQVEGRVRRKDGVTLPARIRLGPVPDPSGEGTGTFLIVSGLSEQHCWDQLLMRSEKLAALGTLAAGVAHNINNVLAAIVARTDLLLRHLEDAEIKTCLTMIRQAALDGANTVRRLQDFARAGVPSAVSPVDVNQVLEEVLQITEARWKNEARLRGTPIRVTTDFASGLDLVVGNGAELREVFTNMVCNAIDAMPAGGYIHVATAEVAGGDDPPGSDRRWVRVEIRDTGVGMNTEVREKVFDPFFTTKGVQGTGLGLSTSYGIIARHGGSIAVESEEGRGSRFVVYLPITPVRTDTPVPSSCFLIPARVRGRILVIEEEQELREVLGNLLRLEGHTVTAVGSGHDGLEAFRAASFDVVVTDLGMADLTGLEVARALRVLSPNVRIVLCTGWKAAVAHEELTASGIDWLLEKPFRLDQALRAVEDLLVESPAALSQRPET